MRAARALVLLFAAAMLTLPACGDGGSQPPTATPASTASPPSTSPTPPSAALEVVGSSAAFFLYQPAPEETLDEVARLFGGTGGTLTPEELAIRNRLRSTAPPLPLLAIPLSVASPDAPFPAGALRAAVRGGIVLAVPAPEVFDGYRGLAALRRVELGRGRPADGYLLEFWTTDAPVAKGGLVDPGARFDAPAFAIAAGSLEGAEPFPNGRRAETDVDGTRVVVTVPAESPVAPETVASLLRPWR
ncbi:hypothetical protein HRbin29_01903 [bacterium HR29]|jgi:hypothetical protein|nr:hypothetical protein HRbin29_01903 [bacterium HR29]